MSDKTTLTPELIGYVKAIALERGIAREQFTAEVAGELMQEALRRMDKLVTELVEGRTWRAENFWRHFPRAVYAEAVIRGMACKP